MNRRCLIIASRTRPAQYTYLKHAFEPAIADVILDRRQRQDKAGNETRGRDRRQRDITTDLLAFGWAVVRH